jgi:anti-sigma B factor antagonist
MQVIVSELGAATRINLVGRLDITGAEKIGLPLAVLAGARNCIVVDMSGTEILASIGLRHLVEAAKAVTRRGGKLVLLGPNPLVADMLARAGLDDLLPVVGCEEEAHAALQD